MENKLSLIITKSHPFANGIIGYIDNSFFYKEDEDFIDELINFKWSSMSS